MRKLTMMAVMLAMLLLAAAPASAQTVGMQFGGVTAVAVDGGFFGDDAAAAQVGNVTAVTVDEGFFGDEVAFAQAGNVTALAVDDDFFDDDFPF